MLFNCWGWLSRWMSLQSRRQVRSRTWKKRRPARVWAGSREAAPLSFEALEVRTLLAGESFLLHSLPGATKRIYLDFTGHTTSGTSWNAQFTSGANIVSSAYTIDGDDSTFSAAEEQRITEIWRLVAEDFAPFNIDVTTQDPGVEALRNTGGSDTDWGVRVVIGGNSSWYTSPNAVGVAYLNSFTWNSDTPVFAFSDRMPDYSSAPFMVFVNTISHEVGHSLGLNHDGISTTQTFGTGPADYYYGHYVVQNGMAWGPIMGSPVIYTQMLSQWSKGEYSGATNTQDDLAIITASNGFDYRTDDHGSSTSTADNVTISDTHNASASGIIERNTDVDYFKFYVQTAGTVQIQFKSALSQYFGGYNAIVTDLDISGTLYNSSGTVVATHNPTNSLEASISQSLAVGTYYFSIDGVGQGDPAGSGYSDYGSLGQYAITVTTSNGALSLSFPNTAPTDISLSNSTIAENLTLGSTVGALSTTDNDSNNTFTYSLVSGTGSADNAKFSISGSTLITNASLNYETQSSYSVRIRTTDQGGLTFDKQFTITLTNVNEAPTDIALSATSIAENNSNPGTVGTLSTTDQDAGNTFTYTLVSGSGSTDNSSFQIVGTSLQIMTIANYEVKNSYSIRVRVTDQGGLTYEEQITISITNANESPTDISLSSSSINENSGSNVTVGTLSGTDQDSGSTFTYSLVSGTGSTDNASFTISGSSLRLTSSANFEAKSSYSVRVRVTDQTSLTFEKQFSITVNDVNETPTNITLSSSTVTENNLSNAFVGTLGTVDPDAGDDFSYMLAVGTGDTDNGKFTINGSSLRIVGSANYETQSSYSIRLRVVDEGGLSFSKVFTITVTNANDAPFDINLSATSIDENNTPGASIGVLAGIDEDAGSTFSFALVSGTGSTDNSSFSIVDDELIVLPATDYESQDFYSIRVRVTDQGGLTFDKVFTINVIDQNELPTAVNLSSTSVVENNLPLDVVATLSADDPDSGSSFIFTLVTGSGSDDNTSFMIVGDELRIVSPADFETQSSYAIRLRATDQGGLFTEQAVVISVIDDNEDPTDISLSSTILDENNNAGAHIGVLSAIDVDANSTFAFSFVTGTGDTDNDSFFIVGDELHILGSADFETQDSYSVRVEVTDQGGLTFEKIFTISIADMNDAPVDIELSATDVIENNVADVTIGFLSAVDVDLNNTFTYSLVNGFGDDDNAQFAIIGDELILHPSADFELQEFYSVRVQVTDQGGLSFEQVFTIEVIDENEGPTDIEVSTDFFTENMPDFTKVATLTALDPDFGNTFTFDLVDGVGGVDNDAFLVVGDELWIVASPDFETQDTYSIRLSVTDQDGLSYEKELTFEVIDENEAPTDLTLSWTEIEENNLSNAVVGLFDAADPDAGESFTYTLAVGTGDVDNDNFEIVGEQLILVPSADFETKDAYSIRVAVHDQGNLVFEAEFTISVLDISENSTDILISSTNVAEQTAEDSVVGTLLAVDSDANESFSYALINGAGDTDNDNFTIDGDVLTINSIPDFEVQSSYSIRVEVTDQDGLTFEKVLAIDITNVNETPTSLDLSNNTLDENNSPNDVVGTFSAIDPDAGDTLTYLLISGPGSTDNGLFQIVNSQLMIVPSADFELKNSYSIRVQAHDAGNLAIESQFNIDVTDVSEAPTSIGLSNTSLPEHSSAGTLVGTLTANDEDAHESFSYTLVNGVGASDNDDFTITGSTLTINAAPDYETKSSYSLRVEVTDQDNLTFEKAFTIAFLDENDAPAIAANQSFAVSEAALNGATVGTVIASDPDTTAPNNTLTYALTGGNIGNLFAINSQTGQITVSNAAALDFEATSQYALQVTVTDAGAGQLSASQVVTVNVTNVNEAPVLPDNLAFTLPENSAVNTVVGSIVATDPDSNEHLIYGIPSGNTQLAFAINPDNGQIRVANPSALDFEVRTSFTLRILVVDSKGATDQTNLTVTLTDIDETHHLQLASAAATWINKRAPVAVLPQVVVTGPELIGGGTLSISVNAVGTAKKLFDQFHIPSSTALGAGSGPHITDGTLTLEIQLNSNATVTAVQNFLRGITFATKGKGLRTVTRIMNVTLIDTLNTSSTVSQTVNVRKKA